MKIMKINHKKSKRRSIALLGFFLLQAIFLTAFAAAALKITYRREFDKVMPVARKIPLRVEPLYDYPRVISDEQLMIVLNKLRPRLRGEKPKINHVDHALRFWGLEAEFDDDVSLSGVEMRDLLLNHRKFISAWGEETAPLLISVKSGVRVRLQEGFATASHVDHTMAGLAEIGVPSDYPIQTLNGVSTVNDLLNRSLKNFSLNQVEYEWSTLAYVLYLAPTKRWYSSEGQEITFDRLADRIMRQRYVQGVCFGNHRLHALVVLLRIDDTQNILTPSKREDILDHLREATSRLVQNQHVQGYWDQSWPDTPADKKRKQTSKDDQLPKQILATGHALEWWALAPKEVHPPREVLVRAGQWLARTIGEMDATEVKKSYTYLSHAGHALAIWRGHEPPYFLKQEALKVNNDQAEKQVSIESTETAQQENVNES